VIKNLAHISYHVIVVLLSAALALCVPFLATMLAGSLLRSWAYVENEKVFLVALEISTAVALIVFINMIRHSWESRKLLKMARSAGMVPAASTQGIFIKRRTRKMKRELGFAREVMIIGSTGYQSFVEREGELHEALLNAREAKIMLLDPLKEGVLMRARSIPDPEITTEVMREQIIRSIDYLKGLRRAQKAVTLKLYPEMPLLKLAILGENAFLRHYHTGMNVRSMPEYAFRNGQDHGGLYMPMYRYFKTRWHDPAIPEYDLDTDEIVYRDRSGKELSRQRFSEVTMMLGTPADESVEMFIEREYAYR